MSLEPRDERRASDADRERVAAVLREQLAEGTITTDELDERLHVAYRARTIGELAVITQDLPVPHEPTPEPTGVSDVTRSFIIHFGVYAVIMVFLVMIWAITGGRYFWPIWPAMGWGVGLAIHGIVTQQVAAAERHKRRTRPAARAEAAVRRPPARPVSTSRWISVMFTDIADSTRLTEALGDAEWSRLRSRHRDMLREQFAAHGGTEVSAQGDGFLARFGSPALAARCAIDIQRRLHSAREEHGFAPKVRIGIHAGEAVEEDDGDVVGRVVNLASRVMSAAEPEEILVTEPVADHLGSGFTLEDRGLRPLRGVPQPRHLLAVVWS